jgi:hypothetical protein
MRASSGSVCGTHGLFFFATVLERPRDVEHFLPAPHKRTL